MYYTFDGYKNAHLVKKARKIMYNYRIFKE